MTHRFTRTFVPCVAIALALSVAASAFLSISRASERASPATTERAELTRENRRLQ